MTIATLSWPAASIHVAVIVGVALVAQSSSTRSSGPAKPRSRATGPIEARRQRRAQGDNHVGSRQAVGVDAVSAVGTPSGDACGSPSSRWHEQATEGRIRSPGRTP